MRAGRNRRKLVRMPSLRGVRSALPRRLPALLLLGLALATRPILAKGAVATAVGTTTTFTVNSTFDEPNATLASPVCKSTPSSVCTLRAAIMASNANPGNDTVVVPTGLYHLTLGGNDDTAQLGDLDITQNLTVVGDGAGQTLVDGSVLTPTDRLFDIRPGVVVTMSALTLQDGTAQDDGGAIRVGDPAVTSVITHLSLSNCALLNNHSTQFGWGGGVYSPRLENQVTITNCTLAHNTAANGAGIYNLGSLTLLNSQVMSNVAGTSGAGLENVSGAAFVTNSTFSGNDSNNGGGLGVQGGTLTVAGSTLRQNSAGQGGGIWVEPGGNLVLQGSTLLSNTTTSVGGGLLVDGQATLDRAALIGNAASAAGGGIDNRAVLTVTDSLFNRNSAGTGGGLNMDGNSATVSGSTFGGNSATNGGGIFGEAGGLGLTNSTVSGNTTTDAGAGIDNHGGSSNMVLANVTVAYNQAGLPSQVGGLLNSGGGVFFGNSLLAWNSYPSLSGPVYLSDCGGSLTSEGNNLVRVGCGFILNSDQVGSPGNPLDPRIGLLTNNGGASTPGGVPPTHALLPGSTAIDAGNPGGCRAPSAVLLTTDQRGQPRPANGGHGNLCDVGAFEYQPTLFLPLVRR